MFPLWHASEEHAHIEGASTKRMGYIGEKIEARDEESRYTAEAPGGG